MPKQYYAGYASILKANEFSYFSILPDLDKSMIVRGQPGITTMEWQSETLPSHLNREVVTFVWIFAMDINTEALRFDFFINDELTLSFTNPDKVEQSDRTVEGKNGVKLRFKGTMLDRYDDLHGLCYLTVPAGRVEPGRPLRFKIKAEEKGSNVWYMTFRRGLEEEIKITAPPVLMKSDSGPAQLVAVDYTYFGQPRDIQIESADGATIKSQLKTGHNRYELILPEVEQARELGVTFRVGGRKPFEKRIRLNKSRKMDLYILPHSHTDIGYTDLPSKIEKKHMAFIDTALKIIEETKNYPEEARYKWNIEVAWALDSYMRHRSAGQVERVLQALRNGDMELMGVYDNILSGLCRPEELLRLFSFAVNTAIEHRLPPIQSAMISDVPGHTWGMVNAMHHAGIKYFSTAPNYFDRIGSVMQTWEDKPFYWLSKNGREKVLVWIPYNGYGASHIMGNRLRKDYLFRFMQRLDDEHYPYEISYMRWSGLADNWGPEKHIADFVKEWNKRYYSPRLILSTTTRTFAAFEERYGATLPRVRGDWTPYWEDGAASSARETALNRNTAEKLTRLQALWAIIDPQSYPAEAFSEAWRNVMLFSEHTWGAAQSISEPESEMTLGQWKEKQAWALNGARQADELQGRLEKLRAGAGKASAVDVFNSNSWPRTGLVSLAADLVAGQASAVKDDQGQVGPLQRLQNGEVVFLAGDVPPLSARRYELVNDGGTGESADLRVTQTTLQNSRLKISLDPVSGNIIGLRAAGVQGNLVDTAKGEQLNQYLFLPGQDLDDLQTSGPVTLRIGERGPVVASIIAESAAPGCNSLKREYRLVSGADYLEIINTIDKKRAPVQARSGDYDFARTSGKEGLHFAFPFKIPAGRMNMEIPYAVMSPQEDQMPSANKNWFTAQHWIDVSNDEFGITWADLDAPMVEVGEISGNILGNLEQQRSVGYWRSEVEPTQKFYSWIMNNHWHTNYKAWQEGVTVFRYAIKVHGGYDALQAGKFGLERSQPLLALPAVNERPANPLFRLSSEHVLVSGLKPADDGSGIIIRLYGAAGVDAAVDLLWSAEKPAAIFKSDISERPIQNLSGKIDVPAWGLVTIRAEYK